jgi:ribosomal protein S18 acetylase RimI-like enzyme
MGEANHIVRKNNIPAMKLYAKLGFMVSGECTRTIEGRSIDFFEMRLRGKDFKTIQKESHP